MGTVARIQKRGKAWYSKRFRLDESDRDKQILIEFEGISSYATVYLTAPLSAEFCGYNSFVVDATDMALYGDQVNDLVVFVDATQIEGWWYEGAGIYRHVNLYKKNKLHIAHWGVFCSPYKKKQLTYGTRLQIQRLKIHHMKTKISD